MRENFRLLLILEILYGIIKVLRRSEFHLEFGTGPSLSQEPGGLIPKVAWLVGAHSPATSIALS
jgi:hypothetical protein